MSATLLHGDCLEQLRTLPDNSVDSVVTDPPYGLAFMGKRWDYDVPSVDIWAECLRVLKPGGHLLAFAGTRTQHRMAVRIEDAGFEIRDMIAWVYGSGFPKSLDVSKAIDKVNGETNRLHRFTAWMRTTGVTASQVNTATGTFMGSHYLTAGSQPAIPTPELWTKLRPLCGEVPEWVDKLVERIAAEREVVGQKPSSLGGTVAAGERDADFIAKHRELMVAITAPATDAAKQWDGWGTALKPALEPITVARKPLCGTVAENVQQHGTGALNVDGCRVEGADAQEGRARHGGGIVGNASSYELPDYKAPMPAGRWPANLIHDGSEEVTALFPVTGASKVSNRGSVKIFEQGDGQWIGESTERGHNDNGGSAARFFKCCPQEETCPLCCLPYAEAWDIMQAWKNTLASIAEKSGWTSRATSEFIARVNAIGPASERIAPAVKSAGSLCDSCAMSIAVALVAIKTSAFNSEELQAILASTRSCKNSILIPSLASFAELWGSIDTTLTTNSLSLLFGSVRDAIANSTRQDTREREERRFGLSRFAYIPKASKADRDDGCGELVERAKKGAMTDSNWSGTERFDGNPLPISRNHHPTVKPTDLMRYLCRLVTPPGGVVLDPFMGSGSTGKAAILEGFRFIGCEREAEYVEIARARIAAAENERAQELPFGPACEQESPTRES